MVHCSLREAESYFAPGGTATRRPLTPRVDQDAHVPGRRGAEILQGQRVRGHRVGVALVGPREGEPELGLDDFDVPRDLGLLLGEDDVGAGGIDPAPLRTALNRVDGQRVKLLALAGVDLLDRQLEAVVFVPLAAVVAEAGAELGVDDHVPRRAVSRVGDGDPELGGLVLEHLAVGRILNDFHLEPGPEHPAGRLAAGLKRNRRRVVKRAGLGRLDLEQDDAIRARRQRADSPAQERVAHPLCFGLAAQAVEPGRKLVADHDAQARRSIRCS